MSIKELRVRARYGRLINPGGESDNSDWDGIWQAAATWTASGWSVEQYASDSERGTRE